jgi:hypothetical protein
MRKGASTERVQTTLNSTGQTLHIISEERERWRLTLCTYWRRKQ